MTKAEGVLKGKLESLRPGDRVTLPTGQVITIPMTVSIDELMGAFEPARIYWMKHFYDPEERWRAINPERFVL